MTDSPDDCPGDDLDPDGDVFDRAILQLVGERLSEEVKQRHLAMLAGLPDRQPHPRIVRLAVFAGGIALFAAAGLGTAAALGVFSAPVTDRSIAHCYATPDPNGAGNHFEVAVADRPGAVVTERDAADIALDICAGAWRDGTLSADKPYLRDMLTQASADRPAPTLVACVLKDGQVAIFPGTAAACGQMGLPVADQ
jgi:hypothetical protein